MKLPNSPWRLFVALMSLHFASSKGIASNRTIIRNYELLLTRLDAYPVSDYFGPETNVQLDDPNHFSVAFDIRRTLPADLKSVYRTFEKNNRNEYVPSLLLKGSVCSDYQNEKRKLPMYACLHYTELGFKECPFPKGHFSANKVRCSSIEGPPMAPGHYWRVNNTWTTNDGKILFYRIFEFTVEHKNGKHVFASP